ncbi:cadherin-87A [Coccinella septempunctata]|uniref:cadherin-87A n=1 Tax=Coccinella septempunctata TaxID=41139 RepID=UPI001D071185|nr:cadherin-87A [Coccinella septempunctata]
MDLQRLAIVFLIFTIFEGSHGNLPPVFTMDMNNLAISEATPVGSVIYTLEGSDPENGTVHFKLEGTDVLQVNAENGDVTVAKPLDFEANSTLNVIVGMEDEANTEAGEKANIISVPVTVIILDENDNAPQFQNGSYEIIITEDTPTGTVIFKDIIVTDKDSPGENIVVTCINLPKFPDACNFFKIETTDIEKNSVKSAIILNEKLNYAEQPMMKLVLKAADGKLSSTAQVIIKVSDIQDTPPHFKGSLMAEVAENAPINTLVMTLSAEDGDKGVPRKVVYEMVNNPMNYFLLDAVTGELRTARPLDKEAIENKEGKIVLTIKACELIDGKKGNDDLTTATTQAIVKIIDVNDETPSFDRREYFVEIPEDIKEGEAIPGLEMTVTDSDDENNSVYSLELQDESGLFNIQPKQGVGKTKVQIRIANASIDYENPNQRKFVIYAIAKEILTDEKLSSTATITITVTDVNDHSPTFDEESYSSTISETASPGTLVTTITANDEDGGHFGSDSIIYHLEGPGSEKFSINNRTGTVTVAECVTAGSGNCLDFESKSEYTFKFTATDDNGKGRKTSVPLRINLTDSNDNAPIFIQPSYRVFVNEGATMFEPEFAVVAKDADVSSTISYSIISGNRNDLFSIDPKTGKMGMHNEKGLEVTNESDSVVTLTVMASDGKYTSTVPVHVTVKDLNNNAPIFTKENYVESIPEDIPIGSIVTSLQATDADMGENSLVEYSIEKGSESDFTIDNSTGLVIVKSKLDYDRKNTYHIEVIATDYGEPRLSGSTTLTINIINTNDKNPYFFPSTQRAEIMEDASIGTIVHNLTAKDPDVNSTDAFMFESIEPITALDKYGNQVLFNDVYREFFYVDKYSGQVKVKNILQRNVAATVRLTVRVTDVTASTLQQGEGLLIITIGDVNDSPPTFLPPWTVEHPVYHLELEEEQPTGTIVATYKATDEDSDISRYEIIPPNEYFTINNSTGVVSINKSIDYEHVQFIQFTIFAFDSGIPQLNASAMVLLQVKNLNDNSPQFETDIYNVTVEENAPKGTKILTVSASDLDKGEYGEVTYELVGEHSKYFEISPKEGVISVVESEFLDHETINNTVIEVVASDGAHGLLKRSVAVPVNINIKDVNDNSPVFNQTEYKVKIMENVRLNPPKPLIQVNATDRDSGFNGNIHYSIIDGNEDDIFLLGIESGILYPHKSLIGQKRQFHLVVEARDEAGNGKHYDRAVIHIQVLNVNDHKPVFIMPALDNATVEITENNAIENYLVMTVKAVDNDEGENGRVTYHLRNNVGIIQETEEFVIDSDTGELRTKKSLDRERTSRYELTLVARDHGSPIWYENERYLSIVLVDMNDNKPEFPDSQTSNPYHFYITENNDIHTKVGQVKALDNDEGNHAKVYYYMIIQTDPEAFYVDKLDGNIFANISFDREVKDEYRLFILASNDPEFYLSNEDRQLLTADELMHDSSIAEVIISVNDLNDNPPIFEQSLYYAAVNAMADINQFVIKVTAVDFDFGPNKSLTYYIKASNLYKYGTNKSTGSIIPSPFNITQNGEVCTATYLAENNQHRFIVDIIARENAFPEREAYAQVHIWIFEPQQLIRIILSRPTDEVAREQQEIIAELSNSTQSLVIIDEIRYHTDDIGNKNENWSDMYVLVIDPSTQIIRPVADVLKLIDSKYDFLKDYYAGYAIVNVVPAFLTEEEETFNTNLAALVALVIVLVVGILTFFIICCCLRRWVISSTDLKKKDTLIKKAIIDDLNTTDNPLWIEQKLKIYEEQELTMQVFNEPEQNARRESEDYIPDENTYATIQHSNRKGSLHHIPTMSYNDELADYATLPGNGHHHNSGSSHSSLRGVPNYYEAEMGFQGSTFQVPERYLNNSNYESYRTKMEAPEMTMSNVDQPEYIAELI